MDGVWVMYEECMEVGNAHYRFAFKKGQMSMLGAKESPQQKGIDHLNAFQ